MMFAYVGGLTSFVNEGSYTIGTPVSEKKLCSLATLRARVSTMSPLSEKK
jgi:hypothetical protein